jgi:hypothetical protein
MTEMKKVSCVVVIDRMAMRSPQSGACLFQLHMSDLIYLELHCLVTKETVGLLHTSTMYWGLSNLRLRLVPSNIEVKVFVSTQILLRGGGVDLLSVLLLFLHASGFSILLV